MSELYILQAFDKRKFVQDEILTAAEAIEMLGISRARMSSLIKSGKIVPVKKTEGVTLFLKEDVEAKLQELIEARKKYRPFEYENK